MRDISNNRSKTYYGIVKDIIENEEYLKLKNIKHHGLDRYEHNKRVSYYSYLVCRILHLDYECAARAGVLHDFFLEDNAVINFKEKMKLLESHPKRAFKKSLEHFELSPKEENIILSHMFPIVPNHLPKYLESWVVDIVDDWVGIGERIFATRKQIARFANILIILMLYR